MSTDALFLGFHSNAMATGADNNAPLMLQPKRDAASMRRFRPLKSNIGVIVGLHACMGKYYICVMDSSEVESAVSLTM